MSIIKKVSEDFYLKIDTDYDLFGDVLANCIDDPQMVKARGKLAHKFAQKYDWNKLAPRWDRLFKRVDNEGFLPPYLTKEFK